VKGPRERLRIYRRGGGGRREECGTNGKNNLRRLSTRRIKQKNGATNVNVGDKRENELKRGGLERVWLDVNKKVEYGGDAGKLKLTYPDRF